MGRGCPRPAGAGGHSSPAEPVVAMPRFAWFGGVAFQPQQQPGGAPSPGQGRLRGGVGGYHLLYRSVVTGISSALSTLGFAISIAWTHSPLHHVGPAQARTRPCHHGTVAVTLALSETPCWKQTSCSCCRPCVCDLRALDPCVPAALSPCILAALDPHIPLSSALASLCPCTPLCLLRASLRSCIPAPSALASLRGGA